MCICECLCIFLYASHPLTLSQPPLTQEVARAVGRDTVSPQDEREGGEKERWPVRAYVHIHKHISLSPFLSLYFCLSLSRTLTPNTQLPLLPLKVRPGRGHSILEDAQDRL